MAFGFHYLIRNTMGIRSRGISIFRQLSFYFRGFAFLDNHLLRLLLDRNIRIDNNEKQLHLHIHT